MDEKREKLEVTRRDFLRTSGLAALSLSMAGSNAPARAARVAAGPQGPGEAGGPYNILFILTDQERQFRDQDLPAGFRLPGHERLAKRGVTFTHAYNCANVCTPARSCIYTGMHIPHTGMFDNFFPWQESLRTDIPTIGGMLREVGYHTAYRGKWHLSKEFEYTPKSGRPEKIFAEELDAYGFEYLGVGDIIGHTLGGYGYDEGTTALAVRWLRMSGKPMAAQGRPWFLAVNLVNPHDIMFYNTDAPGERVQDSGKLLMKIARDPDHEIYRRRWDVKLPPTWNEAFGAPGRPQAHYHYSYTRDVMLGHVPRGEPERAKRHLNYYLNCIRDVDRHFERLLDELEVLGLSDNTIVVATADHGEYGGSHGLFGKGSSAYEESIHVPLVIAHPAFRTSGGKRCKALASHVDLASTLVAMTGADAGSPKTPTERSPGRDLTPLLADPQKARYDAVRPAALHCFNMFLSLDRTFLERIAKFLREGNPPTKLKESGIRPDLKLRGAIRAITDGRHKYVRYFSPQQHNRPENMEQILKYNDLELFDLEADPYEAKNLALDRGRNGDLILAMNEKMNVLIDQEIGEDIGQMLPGGPDVDWSVTKYDP